ncbi:MAG TPA: hypothetical protein VGK20_19425 [Candidatus Binatia bacterium]
MVIAVAAAAAIGVAAARAGSCRVLVALGSVDIEPSPAGMSLRVSGNWEFDNIIQVATGLAFNVLLVRGDNFVRYRYPDQTFSGELAGLASSIDAGIDGKEILSVESAGATEPAARWVTLEAERMKLTSPVLSGDGPISIVAYIVLDGDYMSPIISNTITRPIELPVIDPNQGGDPGGTVTTR